MKKLILYALFFVSVLIFNSAKGQDIIFKNNGQQIEAVVVVVSFEVTRYFIYGDNTERVLEISNDDINKIQFKNGQSNDFKEYKERRAEQLRITQWTQVIKFGLFSPLLNHLSFGYEKIMDPGKNIELKIGIIGIGLPLTAYNPSGSFVKLGYKFIPKILGAENPKAGNGLLGHYIKPEIQYSIFNSIDP
jgi:hypothetical protein